MTQSHAYTRCTELRSLLRMAPTGLLLGLALMVLSAVGYRITHAQHEHAEPVVPTGVGGGSAQHACTPGAVGSAPSVSRGC
jgi:hypothetical protein